MCNSRLLLCLDFPQVHKSFLWLMHYGCPSPKRLQIRSSWEGSTGLDLGRLCRAEKQRKTQLKTTRLLPSCEPNIWNYNVYAQPFQGRKGKSWSGTKDLKKTQPGACTWRCPSGLWSARIACVSFCLAQGVPGPIWYSPFPLMGRAPCGSYHYLEDK